MDAVQSSQHGSGGGSGGRGSKRGRTSGDPSQPSLRPDSQFAAVPQQRGDTATEGGSGDGDGSGGEGGSGEGGSGGGSTSPPRATTGMPPALLHHRHPLPQAKGQCTATPSGASATPAVFAAAGLPGTGAAAAAAATGGSPTPPGWRPAAPMMPPQMGGPPGWRMVPGPLGPMSGAAGPFGDPSAMPLPPQLMADPMAVWYQVCDDARRVAAG